MKNFPFFALLFLLSLTFGKLEALEIRKGVRIAAHSAIGTGKGFWDWYGSDAETTRAIVPSGTGSLILQVNKGRAWAVESGLSLADNRCGLKVGGTDYIFRQPSLEIPLSFKTYFNDNPSRFFMKAGANLTYLLREAVFESKDKTLQLLAENSPGKSLHMGLQTGMGLDIETERNSIWVIEVLYTTFYTSPEYSRNDGSTGDIRYHRFELGLGYLF